MSLDPTLPLFPDSPAPQKSLESLLGSAPRMLRGRLAPGGLCREGAREEALRPRGAGGLRPACSRSPLLSLDPSSPLPRGKDGRGVGWVEPHFSSPAAPRCWLGRSYGCSLRSPGAHAVSGPAGGAEPGGAPWLGARQGTARGSLCSLPIPAELWFLFSSGDLGFWGTSIPLSPTPTILSHLPPLRSLGPVLG